MYTLVVVVHSLLRWGVVVCLVLALVRAFGGWFGRTAWTAADRRAGLFVTIAIDTQVLLGLVLYFALSPMTRAIFSMMGVAMRDRTLRFWAVEHLTAGLLALIAAHVTSVMARRASEHTAKHRRAAIGYLVVAVLLAAAIPWPFLPYGRPLLRFS
jgi:hypothetical protein